MRQGLGVASGLGMLIGGAIGAYIVDKNQGLASGDLQRLKDEILEVEDQKIELWQKSKPIEDLILEKAL